MVAPYLARAHPGLRVLPAIAPISCAQADSGLIRCHLTADGGRPAVPHLHLGVWGYGGGAAGIGYGLQLVVGERIAVDIGDVGAEQATLGRPGNRPAPAPLAVADVHGHVEREFPG